MATRRWLGRAISRAQVDSITIANTWATNDTATITINTRSLTLTVGVTTTTTAIATAIKEMINGDDKTGDGTFSETGDNVAEFADLTATAVGSVVTVTGPKGVPFTMTATESTAGSGTATRALVTAATSPNHVDDANNWSGGAVPTAGDDVYLSESSVSLLYGLDQISGTLTSLTIDSSFLGDVGLPKQNAAGYVEYRPDYLDIDCTTISINADGRNRGSGRIKIDCGSVQTAVTIANTSTPSDPSLETVQWKGTHASNTVTVNGGSVGMATLPDETATVATLRVSNGTVRCGAQCALTTVQLSGGNVSFSTNVTTLTVSSGTATVRGTATVGTLTVTGGTVNYSSSGTATTVAVGSSALPATIDCSADRRTRTFTNFTLHENGTLVDPAGTITLTNGITRGSNARQVSAL